VEQDASRIKVLQRIKDCEARGDFNVDVEDDPPTIPIDPNKIDYLRKKWTSKFKTRWAYRLGLRFIKKLVKTKQLVIRDVIGLENLVGVDGGAVITCNHINIMDNFIVMLGLNKHFKRFSKPNQMFKVVREGNYSQTGFLGFCLRNADTLPIDQSGKNWRLNGKTMEAIKVVLAKGKKVLIYPEQSMWWNYKKPRPTKIGAFSTAAKNNVPIIPCFITMSGEENVEYTLHILPIIPPTDKETMQKQNEKLWRETYEKVYGTKC